jgi:hypothetical protein
MIRFYPRTDQTRMAHPRATKYRLLAIHRITSSANAASPAGSAHPGGSPEAQNNKRSDFIHSETPKMAITTLSSTNLPRHLLRFFAIFIDFCAQNDPFLAPNRPSATTPGESGRWRRKVARRRLAATAPRTPVQLQQALWATPPETLEPNTPPVPQASIDACFCETVKL